MSALDTYLKAPLPEVTEALAAFEKNAVAKRVSVAKTIASLITSTEAEVIVVPAATTDSTAAYFRRYGWFLRGTDLVFDPEVEPAESEISLPEATEAKLEANTSARLAAILAPVVKAVSLSSEEGSSHFLPYEIKEWHLDFFRKTFPGISFSKGARGTTPTLVISRRVS